MSGHKNGSAPEILINQVELLIRFFYYKETFFKHVDPLYESLFRVVKMGNVGLIPGIKSVISERSPWQILRAELKNRPVVKEQEVRGENFSFQCFHCEE